MPRKKSHKEIQQLLDATCANPVIPPPVETHLQVLPLNELTWVDFERLCARLVSTDAAIFDCYRYGKPGEEQSGIDIVARRWIQGRLQHWGYQCKKYSHFTDRNLKKALGYFSFNVDCRVILISTTASTAMRNMIRQKSRTQLWDQEDISRQLKNHPQIVQDFFGTQWRKAFCGSERANAVPDSGEEAVRRIIGLGLDHREWIHSNLLPVIQMPTTVFGAQLPLNPPSIMTADEVKKVPPTKELGGKAWSLGRLTSPEIARLAGCDPKQIEARTLEQWLIFPKRKSSFVELLNRNLQVKCEALGMAFDQEHHRFYFTPENGGVREKTYQAFKRKATRKLAYPYHDKNTAELRFWVHHAARLSFVEFEANFFLRVEPAYAFTKDGYAFLASEDIGPLSTRRKSGERNQNVFNHLVFWGEMLSEASDNIIIDCRGQSVVISKTYEGAGANFGIPSDSEPLENIAMQEDELDLEALGQEDEENDTE